LSIDGIVDKSNSETARDVGLFIFCLGCNGCFPAAVKWMQKRSLALFDIFGFGRRYEGWPSWGAQVERVDSKAEQ
jgi:hypothetical protein